MPTHRPLLALSAWALLCCPTLAPAIEPTRVADAIDLPASDWPWWRGPLRNGTADPQQSPPLEFSTSENVLWKAEIPGRGYSSPTVVGERVFLTTADEASGSQSLLCFDRQSGKRSWMVEVHSSGGMRKNNKSTLASSTPACDGERVFVNFPNDGALVTTALDLQGKRLWQQRISDYVIHQGYGASPALYQNLVIVSADNKGGGALAALDRRSGEIVWRRERPQKPNYPTPTLLHIDGKDQLLMVGCDQIVSYDPLTGKTLWETAGATTECVTSTLTDGQLIYTSGGYPKNHISAVKADGSKELVWHNSERLYVPSLVIHQGYLYTVLDEGIAKCWEASSGKEMWKARLGGTFSSSPVLVGDKIFATNEGGEFFIFRASPSGYERLAKNQLGEEVLSTPTIVGSRIYHRVTHRDANGQRQEMLYCLGH
ncbi:MAG: PQQ-binding-like beta-propeller repeat protein [Planctomycetales bacterium]|nr:PQQ-binding-like beta-propeller repeat protein [Planctomycetales bacterium]